VYNQAKKFGKEWFKREMKEFVKDAYRQEFDR